MDSNKSLLDIKTILEDSKQDLMNLDQFVALTEKQKIILLDALEIQIKESFRLPHLQGLERQRCENSIKIAKGVFVDVFAANTRKGIEEAKNVGLNTVKSVLLTAMKAAIAL